MAHSNHKKTGNQVPVITKLLPVGLAAVLVFAVLCFNTADTVKWLSMVLMTGTVLTGLLFIRMMKQRMNVMILMLTLITAMGGISTAYALSGKFALQGFLYLMTALCTALLLTAVPGKDPARFAATALAGAAGLISLLSIDHVSTRLLSTPVLSFLSSFAPVYEGVSGVEEQVRLTSIFEMPNVFAGCAGLGVLLSLSLAMSAPEKKERRLDLVLLYVNALGFLLAFSMGAVVSVAVAFSVYILTERKQNRCKLLVLMLLTLITVLLGMIPVSMTGLGSYDGFQPVPLLALMSGAALPCIADHYLTERLTALLRRKGVTVFGGVFLAAAVILGVTACLWTGGCTLAQEESLRRAAYPDAGTYTVTASHSGRISVTVESQNRQEAMMHTATVLYSGELEQAVFTVPEDALVVYFNFTADTDGSLEAVTYTGPAGSGVVPLDYRLLPDFIANRLQGLFANQNAIQRLVFFRDGMKLFRQSPLVGQGVGAFESALYSVQSFYYETKYVHNHYIQTLLETGIVGLLLFLGLLILAAVCLIRSRKKENPFVPVLGALLIYMSVHASVEVVFSSGFYLPLAFGVFGLIGLCCGDSLPLRRKGSNLLTAAIGVLLVTFGILLGCNLRAADVGYHATSMEDFQKAARLDPFEWSDYAISYVSNAPKQNVPAITEQAEIYVRKLDREQSNTVHYHLARYCFETGQTERGMEMALKQAKATVSDSRQWDRLFVLLSQYNDGSDAYRTGIQNLVDLMDQWNSENPGQIVPDEAVQVFVEHVLNG